MQRPIRLAAIVAAGAAVIPRRAAAHAVAGARFFVDTNVMDDPGVGDAAILPTTSLQSPDGRTWITDTSIEFDNTITRHRGFGVGSDYAVSAEALWPLDGVTGHNIDPIRQFHPYFDDLMPNTLGQPLVEW